MLFRATPLTAVNAQAIVFHQACQNPGPLKLVPNPLVHDIMQTKLSSSPDEVFSGLRPKINECQIVPEHDFNSGQVGLALTGILYNLALYLLLIKSLN